MGLMRCDLAKRRRCAEMQGFTGLDDRTLREIDPWLRLAPALCMAWTAVGTALGSAAILAALVPFAVAGVFATRHPFDALYEHGLRRRLGTASIPRYGAPRRFACAVASVWLLSASAAFQLGATTLGYVLGASMVIAAGVPTLTGFCIPSWVYGKIARPAPRAPRSAAKAVP